VTGAARADVSESDSGPGESGTWAAYGPSGIATPAAAAVAYVLATFLTDPVFVADTPDMAVSAVARVLGQNCTFLEPGHLLWRPTGYVLLELLGTAKAGGEMDGLLRSSQIQLGWTAWVAGLIAIVSCAVWLQRRVGSVAATAFGTSVILVSKAFLNYSQVGSSYLPALACLMVALLVLSNDDSPSYASIAAGALLGASVLLWGAFAVALPAAIACPILFGSAVRRGMVRSGLAVLGGALTAVVAAAWVTAFLEFDSLAELGGWAATADHGISTGGFPRAVLGFARSYLETGDYGRLVKRYLLGNTADPVSARELFGFPLIGILGFYGGILLAIVVARRHRLAARSLTFFAINAIPVAAFAIAWQGGDLERYLPLVPGVALLTAVAFAAASRWPRVILVMWLVMILVPNALTLGRSAVAADRERMRATMRDVETAGRPRLLIFSHWQDERVQFSRNYPSDAKPLPVRFYDLLSPGTSSVEGWRGRAAARIRSAWDAGTEVFVSERLLSPSPRREWSWVDGDDPRVSWADLHRYFTALSYGQVIGLQGDGFLPLPPTPSNRAVLEAHRTASGTSAPSGCNLPAVVPSLAAAGHFRGAR